MTTDEFVTGMIPADIMEDVPEHKRAEFRRGVLLYMTREQAELYREAEAAAESGTVSHELAEEITRQIRAFAEMVKKKKERIQNAQN